MERYCIIVDIANPTVFRMNTFLMKTECESISDLLTDASEEKFVVERSFKKKEDSSE